MGYVNQINENSVTVAIVKQYAPIRIGDIVNATGESNLKQFLPKKLLEGL